MSEQRIPPVLGLVVLAVLSLSALASRRAAAD
jgi:hypothetical protein